jgi:hypothetical protein
MMFILGGITVIALEGYLLLKYLSRDLSEINRPLEITQHTEEQRTTI